MHTILVPLDGSPFGEHALPLALALARRSGATLLLAHVYRLPSPMIGVGGEFVFDPMVDAAFREQARSYLDDVAQRVSAAWSGAVVQVLLEEPVAPTILRKAQSAGADLIIMSTHGRGGLSRMWLGSVTDQLIRQSALPILALRPQEAAPDFAVEPPLRHILIPVDGSSLAEEAIELALRIGRLAHAHYTLVQVVDPSVRTPIGDDTEQYSAGHSLEHDLQHAREYLTALAEPLRADGLAVDTQTPLGRPAESILRVADDVHADVIALTTHGRGGITRLFVGSAADKVLRGATIPVLLRRPTQAGQPPSD